MNVVLFANVQQFIVWWSTLDQMIISLYFVFHDAENESGYNTNALVSARTNMLSTYWEMHEHVLFVFISHQYQISAFTKKDMDNQPKVVDYAGSNCRINRITKPTAKWDGKGLHFHDIVRKELRSHKVTSFIGWCYGLRVANTALQSPHKQGLIHDTQFGSISPCGF